MKLRWILYYTPSLFMTLLGWILSPVLAMCVRKEYRLDKVKRFNREIKGFDRYYLWKCLSWFATFDNAQDEYFWGVYGDSDKVTIEQYDNSFMLRYWYRICWLCRNTAYGFSQTILGAEPPAWQFKENVLVGSWLGSIIYTTHIVIPLTYLFGWWTLIPVIAINIYLIKNDYTFNVNIGWKAHKNVTRLMYAGRLFTFPKKIK